MALELYNKIAKEFNVTKEKQLHPRQVIAHVTSQVQELQAVINRLIVDTAKARTDFAGAKDENTKSAYQNKVSGFESELRQFVKTLEFFTELEKELNEANPNVESTPADHPEFTE